MREWTTLSANRVRCAMPCVTRIIELMSDFASPTRGSTLDDRKSCESAEASGEVESELV